MPRDAQLVDYYARRAGEYERIYHKPERQNDLAALKKFCAEIFAGRDVLEIACGTGYWTQVISQTAKSVVATDINGEVLDVARSKSYGCDVVFEQADAFDLNAFSGRTFNAGLAAFWWSHLKKSELEKFLSDWRQRFAAGTRIAFMDNRFVPGSSTPISRTDDAGNTYQLRRLDNGIEYEVLKNFPGEKAVRALAGNYFTDLRWTELTYFWLLTAKLK